MGNLVIFIILAVLVTVSVILVISILRQKKKNQNSSKESSPQLNQLNEWIRNAKARGKGYAEMKTLLENSGWERNMVEKALRENGVY